ncbi:MAG: aspartate carbamoyltransferase catalytic subunit [Bacillota bacterium]|nr:MAG: aspartate carbamoyltransferase catalytic subunit [Bacillota bacterium]
MGLRRKDILTLEDMDVEEMTTVLDTAESLKEILSRDIKKVPTLRGKSVLTLFYEASTRTRTSFELAGKYMSADTVNIATTTSAVVKGETLKDTAWNVEAMGIDCIVMRHPVAGAPHFLARLCQASVINAGDGMHEHPTQGLLDMFSIRERKGRLVGLKVAIIGDILHSRVARSDIWGLGKMGAEVWVAGPPTLVPPEVERMGPAFGGRLRATHRVDEAIEGADVVMVLRLQLERQKKGLFPSIREYSRVFGVNRARLALAKDDFILMHPGPMNRGVEIASDVADADYSVILEQVTNGVAVRMAILYLLLGGSESPVQAVAGPSGGGPTGARGPGGGGDQR